MLNKKTLPRRDGRHPITAGVIIPRVGEVVTFLDAMLGDSAVMFRDAIHATSCAVVDAPPRAKRRPLERYEGASSGWWTWMAGWKKAG